jgi:hypothetical protein
MALRLVSAADFALALAMKEGTFRLVVRESRFGDEFYSLEDDKGVITVENSHEEAMQTIKWIEEAVA